MVLFSRQRLRTLCVVTQMLLRNCINLCRQVPERKRKCAVLYRALSTKMGMAFWHPPPHKYGCWGLHATGRLRFLFVASQTSYVPLLPCRSRPPSLFSLTLPLTNALLCTHECACQATAQPSMAPEVCGYAVVWHQSLNTIDFGINRSIRLISKEAWSWC